MDVKLLADKLDELGVDEVSIQGNDVMARCPFHPDRSPSFGIHPTNGANCFACAVKFHTADAALEAIAKKNGREYEPLFRSVTPDYLMAMLNFSGEPDPQPLNPNVLKFYKEDVDYFVQNWKVSPEVCERRGLVLDPYSGTECFPIFDVSGNYWGVVERLPPDGSFRSRYHYPPGYPRSQILLGEDKAEGEVWIVEGVRDLCAVESKVPGVSAVALGGAKVSKQQLDKMTRFGKIVLALDNDPSGWKCTNYLKRVLPNGHLYEAKYVGKDPMEAESFDVRSVALAWSDIGV